MDEGDDDEQGPRVPPGGDEDGGVLGLQALHHLAGARGAVVERRDHGRGVARDQVGGRVRREGLERPGEHEGVAVGIGDELAAGAVGVGAGPAHGAGVEEGLVVRHLEGGVVVRPGQVLHLAEGVVADEQAGFGEGGAECRFVRCGLEDSHLVAARAAVGLGVGRDCQTAGATGLFLFGDAEDA